MIKKCLDNAAFGRCVLSGLEPGSSHKAGPGREGSAPGQQQLVIATHGTVFVGGFRPSLHQPLTVRIQI
eukprot:1157087-Pelagomonas_calceolata.AAC.5